MGTTHSVIDLRGELKARLNEARARTDEIFALLTPQAMFERPIAERHRMVFYLGHVEAFDWNLIARRAAEVEPFHPEFDKLFAFGIDPTDGGLPKDQPSDWPERAQIDGYNARVRETIDRILDESDLSGGDRPLFDRGLAFEVGIEHRLMHAETLAYLIHQLPYHLKRPSPAMASPPGRGSVPRTIPIPAGRATLGLERGKRAFGWDNEFERTVVEVPAFAIDQFKVTNAQYLEFVRSGGYAQKKHWRDADWAWKEASRTEHPRFWREAQDGTWRWRSMFAEIPLPTDGPVFVSHAEASAYARWAGKSLPTEAQFHRAAYGTADGRERAYPWGDEAPDARRGNFDLARWDTTPVDAHPLGDSAFGVSDLLGNGWEWTSSLFEPFPGFERFPFYPGYSADFFDGKHYVMKGGSPRTAACMLRRSFRNWFQPHYPYVYAAFRCVEA